jgi:REP element-mobilizing transposase RayT
MSYWRLYSHIVWGTKDREPMLNSARSQILEQAIIATSAEYDCLLHATGVMPDHVHVAISIPPKNAVAEVVKRFKGTSSRHINQLSRLQDGDFAWQPEYGIISFGEKSLDDVVAYVRNQRAHHEKQTLRALYETYESPSALITPN